MSEHFFIVVLNSYEPLAAKNCLRYLAHVDYHCQTTTQIVEAKLYKGYEAATKAAIRFNSEYKAGLNEAAREHRTQYSEAIAMALVDDHTQDSLFPLDSLAKQPWKCPLSGLWYNKPLDSQPNWSNTP